MTKIANALFIFLLIICIIMLSILVYRHFYPPMTIRKETSVRPSHTVISKKKQPTAVVALQTTEILPDMKDTSVAGRGVIIDRSGLILTNLNVVSDARNIHVTLNSGASYKARMIVADPANDIALLQIKNPQIGLPVIPLALSEKHLLREYESDFYGLKNESFNWINRFSSDGEYGFFTRFLQPDTLSFDSVPFGPLVNLDGRLTGMNVSVKRNNSDVNFTLPLERIENILARYLIPERMQSLYFGLIPRIDRFGKIKVARVFPGSPAYLAGIRRGMEISALNGWTPKHNLLELSRHLIRLNPDQPVKIQLRSVGVLSIKPVPFSHCSTHVPLYWKLGLYAENLSSVKSYMLRYPLKNGVVVTGHTFCGNPFRRGDVIIKWNRKTINNTDDLKKAVENAPIGSKGYALVYSVVTHPEKGTFLMSRIVPVMIR